MKTTQRRIRLIAGGLLLVGAIAWINTIATFILTSDLIINAELILLFAGMGLLRQNGRRTRYSMSLIVLAGIVVILIPVTAFTLSPTVSVSLFGEQLTPSSFAALLYIVLMTLIYLGTLIWLVLMLRKDLRFEDFSES